MLIQERTEREKRLVEFIQKELSPGFDKSSELLAVLDSVAFLRIVMFIESDFGVTLDMGHMGVENFQTVDTLLDTIESV